MARLGRVSELLYRIIWNRSPRRLRLKALIASLLFFVCASSHAIPLPWYDTAEAFFAHLPDQQLADGYRERLRLLETLFGKRDIRKWLVRSRAHFHPGDRSISVPISVESGSVDDAVAIFTHEYAHVIAEDYVITSLPAWRDVITTAQSEQATIEMQKELAKEGLTDSVLTPMTRASSLQRALSLRGYHEFIADVFAVVIAGDNDTMAKAIASQYKGAPYYHGSERRSFNIDLKSAAALAAQPLTDEYDRFMSTRAWFGRQPYAERFLRDPRFLRKVLVATMKAANRQITSEMSVEQINANLQRQLRSAFR